MSSAKLKKPRISDEIYKNRLNSLKKLGVAPKIDLRKKLTKKEKSAISRAFNKVAVVANSAPGEFKAFSTTKMSKEDIKIFKSTGYLTRANKVFVPMHGHTHVKIQRAMVPGATGKKVRQIRIIRNTHSGFRDKTETEYLGEPIHKMFWRDRLMRDYKAGKFHKDEFLSLKLYDNNTFTRKLASIDKLLDYVANEMQINDGADPDTLRDNLHLVKIRVSTLDAMNVNIPAHLTKTYNARKRRENRQKTKSKIIVNLPQPKNKK